MTVLTPGLWPVKKKSIAEEKFKILKKIKNLQIKNRGIRENDFFIIPKCIKQR